METNKPLYLTRDYRLTYEPDDLPTHYAFIQRGLDIERLERQYRQALSSDKRPTDSLRQTSRDEVADAVVRRILAALDERGAWVEQGALSSHGYKGPIIDSRAFFRNVETLSRYLAR